MSKKVYKPFFILFLIFYASIVVNYQIQSTGQKNINLSNVTYLEHSPIHISDDEDFERYGFQGSGTINDPYRIEGLNITTTDLTPIEIFGTSKYFIISNCFIKTTKANKTILLSQVANGTAAIIYNKIIGVKSVIRVFETPSVTIYNNTIIASEPGYENFGDGLGLWLSSSPNSKIANNIFVNCSLVADENLVEDYLTYTVTGNFVNNLKLGWLTNLNNIAITEPEYGQLIIVNCENVTIKHQIMQTISNAIISINSTELRIEDCTIRESSYGIIVQYSVSVLISNCQIEYAFTGIELTSSNDVNIYNMRILDIYYIGIMLKKSAMIHISSSVLSNVWHSSYCLTMSESNNCVIANNLIMQAVIGLMLTSVNNTEIANNTIAYNGGEGIYIELTHNCVIWNNDLIKNNYYAVAIYSGSENVVYLNKFIDNAPGLSSQAYDDGENNIWYNATLKVGNFWSDCSGAENYQIDGSAKAMDIYPIGTKSAIINTETDEFPYEILVTILTLIGLVVIPVAKRRN